MKIGFTGSRKGMTPIQFAFVLRAIAEMRPEEVHHGQCIGADEEFHRIAQSQLIGKIISHPGTSKSGVTSWRSFNCNFCQETRREKPFLDRNKDIVNETDFLIACPRSSTELIGGTWFTIKYAIKFNRDLIIIYPDGNFKEYRKGFEYETQ